MREIVHVEKLTEEGMKMGRETDIEKRGFAGRSEKTQEVLNLLATEKTNLMRRNKWRRKVAVKF
jgi:hypothetical protein